MYEELIKSLRKEAEGTYHFIPKILCLQAADAIETLENTLKIYRESIYSIDNQLPRWISVEERLPEIPEGELMSPYVVALVGGELPHISWTVKSNTGKQIWALPQRDEVTHWMPLPEPPKEETDG